MKPMFNIMTTTIVIVFLIDCDANIIKKLQKINKFLEFIFLDIVYIKSNKTE